MELTIARFKSKAEAVLAAHDVRAVGFGRTRDEFDDWVYYVHPHFNDIRFADADAILGDLRKVFPDTRVAFSGDNHRFVVKEV